MEHKVQIADHSSYEDPLIIRRTDSNIDDSTSSMALTEIK